MKVRKHIILLHGNKDANLTSGVNELLRDHNILVADDFCKSAVHLFYAAA